MIVISIVILIVIMIVILVVIAIVTTHPFFLPSIGQPHSQFVSLVDWASIRFSIESNKYHRRLCQIRSSSKKIKMSLTLARTLTTAPLTRWALDMDDSPISSIIISWWVSSSSSKLQSSSSNHYHRKCHDFRCKMPKPASSGAKTCLSGVCPHSPVPVKN